MRGLNVLGSRLFSYVALEGRVPRDHPLHLIRAITEDILSDLSPALESACAQTGRPSILPV